ncbi:MAG TPA: hypothetical protein VNQ90_21390 [Chthoniobacteraceae bacterium]|nr:hypothetical protein [Chthoniobacteraceae bacterium]
MINPPPPFTSPSFRGRFGVARRDITPPPGIYSRNWGAATSDVAMGVHRPLTLTVLTLHGEGDNAPLAILALDLGWWRSAQEERILKEAVLAAGIAQGRYLIALSHTHAGPVFCPGQTEQPGGEKIADYLQSVVSAMTGAIGEALSNAQPGLLETATGSCGLAANRDFPDPERNGERLLVGWNPAAEADQTVLVGRMTDAQGRALATLVNYACHPTILAWENNRISPDFVGAMREVVETETGAPTLFLQGASGDLAPRHQYVGDLNVADRAGRCLGHAVLSILFGMPEPGGELVYRGAVESGAPLALWATRPRTSIPTDLKTQTTEIALPIKPDLPSEAALLEAIRQCSDRVEGERLARKLFLRRSLGDGEALVSPHYLWQCGEIVFVSVANEVYSSLQSTLRAAAAPRPLFVITVANGGRGYLSPADSYRLNSYASWQSPFAEGCFEQTIAVLESAVRSFQTNERR